MLDGAAPDEEDVSPDVVAWLEELKMSEHQAAVLKWCDDMGAASLEEVVESIEDLKDAITLKPLQARRLVKGATEAMAKVKARAEEKCCQPKVAPVSFYKASSCTAALMDERDRDVGDTDVYLKQRPSERATWMPMQKMDQGTRKKQQKQAAAVKERTKTMEVPDKAKQNEDAAKRLAEQLAEEQLKSNEVLLDSIRHADAATLQDALAGGRKAGLSADDLARAEKEAKQKHCQQQQAVADLSFLLDQPRTDGFGHALRKALDDIKHLCAGEGSAATCLSRGSIALEEWEQLQEKQGEAKMAIQFALRRGEEQALKVALDEGRVAGLSTHSLFQEASRELLQLQDRARQDRIAAEHLQRAMKCEELEELRTAVGECTVRKLPLNGADVLLERLTAEAEVRHAASAKLERALASKDVMVIRAAIDSAKHAGLQEHTLDRAEQCVLNIEVEGKRREIAKVELCLAHNTRDTNRLKCAISEGYSTGVDSSALHAAEQRLHELLHAQDALTAAMASSQVKQLQEALKTSAPILGKESLEVAAAESKLDQLEQEAHILKERHLREIAEAKLQESIDSEDWDGIENGIQSLQKLGVSNSVAIMKSAVSALDSMRDLHEHEQAKLIVNNTMDRIQQLSERESSLKGPSHKKERAAIGKELLALRSGAAYLSAKRFLKDPEGERQHREQRLCESQKREQEELQRQEQRRAQAEEELSVALKDQDEDTVRALLIEGALSRSQKQLAEAFAAEQDQRRSAAEQDAALLEFCFAQFDKRAFFQASIALNELFSEKYSMQEGTDFKLKVVKACNSVVVAFRSPKFAEAVATTCKELTAEFPAGHPARALMSSQVHGPLEFSNAVEDVRHEMRQDAEKLQSKSARREAEQRLRELHDGPELQKSASSSCLPVPGHASTREFRSVGTTQKDVHNSTPAKLIGTDVITAELGRGRSIPSGHKKGTGKGKATKTGANDAGSIPIPLWAANALQRDQDLSRSFHRDLKTFAARFHVAAELQGFKEVGMRPIGFVHHEAVQQAREELRKLVDFHFPQRVVPEHRQVHLRVDAECGANIELTPTEHGYRVDYVDEFPGQSFAQGDVILAINDHSLQGLTEHDIEDTFAENFGDGAALLVARMPESGLVT